MGRGRRGTAAFFLANARRHRTRLNWREGARSARTVKPRAPAAICGAWRAVLERMPERRFPPPWTVEETDACFIVRHANGQALAYVYFEEERGGDRRHIY